MVSTGQRVKWLRESKAITQKELSDITGINKAGIQRIEKGSKFLSENELRQLADFFNVPADYILGRKVEGMEYNSDDIRLLGMFHAAPEHIQETIIGILEDTMGENNGR